MQALLVFFNQQILLKKNSRIFTLAKCGGNMVKNPRVQIGGLYLHVFLGWCPVIVREVTFYIICMAYTSLRQNECVQENYFHNGVMGHNGLYGAKRQWYGKNKDKSIEMFYTFQKSKDRQPLIMEEGESQKKTLKSILREIILLNISNNCFIPTFLSVYAMPHIPKPVEGQGNINQWQLRYSDARSLETHAPFHWKLTTVFISKAKQQKLSELRFHYEYTT